LDADARNRTQTETWSIRRATVADARAIAEIGVLGWQAAYRGLLPHDLLAGLSVGPREVAWRSMLESDPEGAAPAWVAESDSRVVGFLSGGPPRDEDVPLPAAEVYAIYVLPEAWRRGVGRALLTTAVEHWRARGATTLVLWVLEANARGRAFYEALGWRADGHRQMLTLGGSQVPEVRYRLRP
jgi:GNAT superfamily N-acetyltransferase